MPVGIVVAHSDQKLCDRIAVAIRERGFQVYTVGDVKGVLVTASQARICVVLVEPALLAKEKDLRPRIAEVMGFRPPIVALTHEAGPIREILMRHGASVLAGSLDDLRPLVDVLAEVARRLESNPRLQSRVTDSSSQREGLTPVRKVAEGTGEATVLVVDDELSFRTFVSELLKDEGYRVFTAASALDAVQFLANKDVDLVVSDINMPEMDGFQLKLEADRLRNRAVPFIAITADASLENVFNADSVGAVTVLAKPLRSIDDFLQTVRSSVGKKALADRF